MIAPFPIRDLLRFPGSALCRAPLVVSARKALSGARGKEEPEARASDAGGRFSATLAPARGLALAWRPTGPCRVGREEESGGEGAMSRREERLGERCAAAAVSSRHAEFVYANVNRISSAGTQRVGGLSASRAGDGAALAPACPSSQDWHGLSRLAERGGRRNDDHPSRGGAAGLLEPRPSSFAGSGGKADRCW